MKKERNPHSCKRSDRIGEKHIIKDGYMVEIVEYYNSLNTSIKFENGVILKNIQYSNIISGKIKNTFHPTINGVGYLGYLDGSTKVKSEDKEAYSRWRIIMMRCYSTVNLVTVYKDSWVHEEWHNFQNFKEWFNKNNIPGYHIDKDILVKGNKVYSSYYCCFVPVEINNLFIGNKSRRGSCPIGVFYDIKNNKFTATYAGKNLGRFNNPEEAFLRYKEFKENRIEEFANKFKYKITLECYNALLNYKVEITD